MKNVRNGFGCGRNLPARAAKPRDTNVSQRDCGPSDTSQGTLLMVCGREKCKEWFRLRPKPPRPRGKATRYECKSEGLRSLRHLPRDFVDGLSCSQRLHGLFCFWRKAACAPFLHGGKEKDSVPARREKSFPGHAAERCLDAVAWITRARSRHPLHSHCRPLPWRAHGSSAVLPQPGWKAAPSPGRCSSHA